MKLVFDLHNLNRTADYLVKKNPILRNREDNPLRYVMNQLIQAVEAKLKDLPVGRLQEDAQREVAYTFEGQSGVCFGFAIEGPEGNLSETPLYGLADQVTENGRYALREVHGMAGELAGYVLAPQFFVRLGKLPSNLPI